MLAGDAVGALAAAAVTGTLIGREDGLPLALSLVLADEPSWSVAAGWMPGPPRRVGPQGRSPPRAVPGVAERSGAALI